MIVLTSYIFRYVPHTYTHSGQKLYQRFFQTWSDPNFSKFCFNGTMIFETLAWPIELYMTKYIIGEIFSSGGATLYNNPLIKL